MLRLDEHWLWDFWCAHDGERHHLFYLQAPRSLGDPELRHAAATVGHAVSEDLGSWEVLDDGLRPGVDGAWDDRAVWTGSIVRGPGAWWCFYTGTSRRDGSARQRIGAMTSPALTGWARVGDRPLIEIDAAHYETLGVTDWPEEAWRDPWLLEGDEQWTAFITARGLDGPVDGRGVVARATSVDLHDWVVGAPLPVEPAGQYAQLEVPQVIELSGRWYLLFCAEARVHSAAWRARTGREPRTGTYYAVSDSQDGPFHLVDGEPLGPSDGGTYFAGRIVETSSGPQFLAWCVLGRDGDFRGELIDPMPVAIDDAGHLVLKEPSRS